MRNTKKKTITTGMSAVVLFAMLQGTAYALPHTDELSDRTVSSNTSTEGLVKVSKEIASITNYNARLIVSRDGKTQVIDLNTPTMKLGQILRDNHLDPADFRFIDNTPVVESITLKAGSTTFIYGKEMDTESSITALNLPVEKRENPDLPKGEEKVIQEGVSGEALKTVLRTKNLATGKDTVEETLTVLKKPVKRIVEVGTKEEPPPVEEEALPPESEVASRDYSRPTLELPSNIDTSTVRGAVVSNALSKVGSAYSYGAAGEGGAYDCSGLVMTSFASQGIYLPRVSGDQGRSSTPISWNELQPGDILWSDSHVAIYIGNGQIVHASTPSRGVVIDPVSWYSDMTPGRIIN